MDESQEAVKNNAGEDTNVSEAPTEEGKTTESLEEKVEQSPDQREAQPEQPNEDVQVKKQTRAERRLQQLLGKYGDEGKEEAYSHTQDNTFSEPYPPFWQPQVEPGSEVSPEQYQADVTRNAQEIARLEVLKLRQEMAEREDKSRKISTFKDTVSQIEKQYSVLNPDSDDYNETLSDKVSLLYEKAAGKQPNAELLQSIVETVMSASEQARLAGESRVTGRLVEQSQQSAIAPTGGVEKSDLSEDEMQEMKRKNPGKLAKLLEKKLTWTEN